MFNSKKKSDILFDQYRFTGKWSNHVNFWLVLTNRAFRRIYYYRKLQATKGFVFLIFQILNKMLHKKMSVEIPRSIQLGKGVLLLHPYSITFNSGCVIGDNFTILKGATIGNSKSGKVGTPTIGNNVYVGLNSTVVGGIHVGNDVMIAANTFVNFDVPDGALVIGSPGVIHRKTRASAPYTNNSIENIEKR